MQVSGWGCKKTIRMAVAEPPDRPAEILPAESDFAYRFPTDAEMTEAICVALGLEVEALADGRRLRRVNHVIQMVHVYYRDARATGARGGHKKRAAAAAALWPDINCQQDVKRKRVLRRWEEIAEAAGLLRVRDGRGARALHWELLNEWQRYAGALRGYSSVGKAASTAACAARRRRETRSQRHQRRVRPYCRRVGNNTASVGRLQLVSSLFLSSEKSAPSGLLIPPTGVSTTLGLDACTRAVVDNPVPIGIDTPEPPGWRPSTGGPLSNAGAALDSKQRRTERRAEAERLFAEAFGAPAGGPLLDPGPLIDALAKLDRIADKTAALNGWEHRDDRAILWLGSLIASEADSRRRRGQPPIRHLGWFVPRVLQEAGRVERKTRARRQAADRRRRALAAVELVEQLRDPDPARGGRGSRPRPREGSDARRT